jgi:F-type H+-transporting ATPase subunit delta
MNFLLVLVQRHRQGLLDDLPEAFQSMVDKSKQVLRGHVTSARTLLPEDRLELVKRIEARTNRVCECDFAVDAALYSGFRLVIGDKLIDCSSAGALARLRREMMNDE